MNSFLAKLTNLSYEMFGIFLPGLFGIALCTGDLVIALTVSGTYSPQEVLKAYSTIVAEQLYSMLAGLAITSYIMGHLLKWLSKNGLKSVLPIGGGSSEQKSNSQPAKKLKINKRWVRFLLLLNERPLPPNESVEIVELVKLSWQRLASALQLGDLKLSKRAFYLLAKTYIWDRDRKSLLATYQNKYTFHRSLATLFSVQVWISLIVAASFYIFSSGGLTVPIFLSLAGISLILVRVFTTSFEYFWTLLGDIVCAELLVQLSSLDNSAKA